MTFNNDSAIDEVRTALREGNLTLFLGAGVSVGNGLPEWSKLVLSMYFSTISEQRLRGYRPFANYLYAISEWYLPRLGEPLEVTSRRLKTFYQDPGDVQGLAPPQFLSLLHRTLYAGFLGESIDFSPTQYEAQVRAANPTLDAVTKLCEAKFGQRHGVNAVVTYNFDDLLEAAMQGREARPIFRATDEIGNALPIFHVHGYVPFEGGDNWMDQDIVFIEEDYNQAASDPYCWTNLVQLRALTGSVGLMIGLSMSDRNIRRLLDAASRSPTKPTAYALMQLPKANDPPTEDIDMIHENAIKYLEKFENSGVKSARDRSGTALYVSTGVKSARPIGSAAKKGPRYAYEIRGIIKAIDELERSQKEEVFKRLGIQPIWYKEHPEIPRIVDQIIG